MKVPSRRTWLVVAAGVLVLAGAGVVYVIKNPSLPPGWRIHETDYYQVALPPGEMFSGGTDEKVPWHITTIDGPGKQRVVISTYMGAAFRLKPAEETLDALTGEKDRRRRNLPPPKSDESFQHRGHPARVITSTAGDMKRFVVLVSNWAHDIEIRLASGGLTEADADFLIRSFRPK